MATTSSLVSYITFIWNVEAVNNQDYTIESNSRVIGDVDVERAPGEYEIKEKMSAWHNH